MARRMFDLTSSKLLILGIVALIVVGPKDLPVLLRTIGRYVGMIRRHAAEFRSQFDAAIRESELDQLKKEMDAVGSDMSRTFDEAHSSVSRQLDSVKSEVDSALGDLDAAGRTDAGRFESGKTAEAAPGETPPATARLEAPETVGELPALPATPHPGVHDMKSGA